MKKRYLLLLMLIIPFNVFAKDYSNVGYNITYEECVNFQDKSVAYGTSGYFGHCVRAKCYGGTWVTNYYDFYVKCANGNTNKYYVLVKDGCNNYRGSCIISNEPRYCTSVAYYDCNRKSDGTPFQTTPPATQATQPTTKKTYKTVAPTVKPTETPTVKPTEPATSATTIVCNNYLKSLTLSVGKISFNKLTTTYKLSIDESTTKIDVKATPELSTSTVKVENNDTINFATPIKVTVTSQCGDTKVYEIILTKATPKADDDNSLSSLKIKGYNIKFDPQNYSYEVKIGKNVTKLDITAKTKSSKATYKITGNSNLKNGSEIDINVTAENGDESTYVIIVKKSGNLAMILIILIVIGIIGYIGYKLVKKILNRNKDDDNYDSSGSGYEYE